MDYGQARAYLREVGQAGSVYGLVGIRNLMEKLGNAHERLRCIHVAGTNGKGSVCLMVAAILQKAGFRTGRYSSPAVFSNEEIYQIDGKPIEKPQYAEYVAKCKDACEKLIEEGKPRPSAFEIETAIAFCYFADMQCEYAVIETGLGGLEDATNIIENPVCSIITSISRDHMQLLGESISEIASAKAGIIKPGCPIVSAAQPEDALMALKDSADRNKSRLVVSDPAEIKDFTMDLPYGSRFVYQGEPYVTPMSGAYQRENIICVFQTIEALRSQGLTIPVGAVKAGLSEACLPGRMECLSLSPEFYIDGAHNESAAAYLRQTLEACFSGRRLIYLVGVLADKEYEKVLAQLLPLASEAYMVTPDNPRALPGSRLADAALRMFPQKQVSSCPSIREGMQKALLSAKENGVALAFGSLSFLKELKRNRDLYEDRR